MKKLKDIEDFDEKFKTYKKNLIHAGTCTRSEIVEADRLIEIWKEFRIQMKIVMKTVRMK